MRPEKIEGGPEEGTRRWLRTSLVGREPFPGFQPPATVPSSLIRFVVHCMKDVEKNGASFYSRFPVFKISNSDVKQALFINLFISI